MSAALIGLSSWMWAGILGGPVVCPAEIGQLRWSEVQHELKASGRTYTLYGSVWDRDTDQKISSGDLMRVERLSVNGRDAGIDETWVILKGAAARGVARDQKKQALEAQCESRFDVKGVPKVSTGAAFAKHLKRVAQGGVEADPLDAVRADMGQWAEGICKSSKGHLSEADLSKKLLSKAKKAHRKIRRGDLRALAAETASQYAVACARLDPGTLR